LLYPDIAPRELASRWQQAGVAVVIVTKGEHGALGWCADGTVEMAAVGVKVKDTVGAGDSFQAAMLAWFAEQGLLSAECLRKLSIDQLRSAMSFAAQAGALTCSRSGADLPRRAELPGTSAVLRS
jgi:fructokinase